jgi:site-specific recombinase XerD
MNARGEALTRYGVRYLLRRYVQKASRVAPSLKNKKLHPHSIRHSTAVALLKSGVDFATISQWLGHAGLNTTMRYARADLDLKRRALAQVFPDAVTPPRVGDSCSMAQTSSDGCVGSRPPRRRHNIVD